MVELIHNMTAETPRPLQPDPIRQTDFTKPVVGTSPLTKADSEWVAMNLERIKDWRKKISEGVQEPGWPEPLRNSEGRVVIAVLPTDGDEAFLKDS